MREIDQRERDIFEAALKLPPKERPVYLDLACGGDAQLRQRIVEALFNWIVMNRLEKDRTRRYETANGLAVDIQRHLNDELVVARPPSQIDRFQKMVKRNKLAFAAAGAVAAALLVGITVSTGLVLRAKQAERAAVTSPPELIGQVRQECPCPEQTVSRARKTRGLPKT